MAQPTPGSQRIPRTFAEPKALACQRRANNAELGIMTPTVTKNQVGSEAEPPLKVCDQLRAAKLTNAGTFTAEFAQGTATRCAALAHTHDETDRH
jgi:hypothetical protein